MNAWTARERRLVALGILVLGVTLLWFALVQPVVSGFADRAARKEELARNYAQNAAIIARLPVWRRQLHGLRADQANFAIAAANRSDASARLIERVSAAAKRNGAVIKLVQDEPARPGWARVRLDASMGLRQLTQLIAIIENERPVLVVESLTGSADQAFRTGRLSPMDIRLEIAAPFEPLARR
jgi:type II secretory pathway component PulM